MPRRSLLSANERESLLAFPESHDELIRHYSFTESDLALIRQRRGASNRLGFAVQMALLRYPGQALGSGTTVPDHLLHWVAKQVKADAGSWIKYGERDETRREHFGELRAYLDLTVFGRQQFRHLVGSLTDLAMQTDKGILLAGHALETLRTDRIILPAMTVVERACAEAVTRANRRIYHALTASLQPYHRRALDKLLDVMPDSHLTWLSWLRQSPAKPNSRYMKEHIDRLRAFRALSLPDGLGHQVHQNRLLKMAREGGQMQPSDLAKFEDERRYATLAALAIEGTATVTDELVELHDRIMMKLFSAAKNKHQQAFQQQGKAINDKVRLYSRIGQALVRAKASGADPYQAIEAIIPWDDFAKSVTEAGQLAQPESFDHLHLVAEQYATLRRYTVEFLDVLQLKEAPSAQGVLDAIDLIRHMNDTGARKVPEDAPTAFIKARWKPLVIQDQGIDRRFYEICALSELKNLLRSGDIWVKGSRQFRDFEDYLLPQDQFGHLKSNGTLPVAVDTRCDEYLHARLLHVEQQLASVNRLAKANALPDAIITDTGLKITPQDTVVPESAQALIDITSGMLPRIKITELLLDVDDWTGFTRHFVHLKTGDMPQVSSDN